MLIIHINYRSNRVFEADDRWQPWRRVCRTMKEVRYGENDGRDAEKSGEVDYVTRENNHVARLPGNPLMEGTFPKLPIKYFARVCVLSFDQ